MLQKRIASFYPTLVSNALASATTGGAARTPRPVVLLVTHGGYISKFMKYLVNSGRATISESIGVDEITHAGNTSITTLEYEINSAGTSSDSSTKASTHTDTAEEARALVTTFSYAPHLEKNTLNFRDGQ